MNSPVNHTIIRDCWEIIRQTEPKSLSDPRLPLLNIAGALSYFRLDPLPAMETSKSMSGSPSLPRKPDLEDLTDLTLTSLRRHIHAQTEPDAVAAWAEMSMRFCELRYRELRAVVASKSGSNRRASQTLLLHVAAFLMDQYIDVKDIRLLNTVLKLAELDWVLDKQRVKDSLARGKGDFIEALIQFRVLLATEYALSQLDIAG